MKMRTGKITAILFAVLLVFSLSSCVVQDTQGTPETEIEKDEEIISEDDKQGVIDVAEGMLGVSGNKVFEYNGNLGYGYNLLTSAYYNPLDIKAAYPIIDMDSLAAAGKVYVNNLTNAVDAKMFQSHSTKEYSQRITAAARCQGKIGLTGSFNASFAMDYNSEIKSNQVLISVHSKLLTRRDFMYNVTEITLADYVTDGFVDDVKSLKPEDLFGKYGTHVLKDIYMGGRFELNYIYTNVSNKSDEEIMVSVSASNAWVSGNVDERKQEAKKDVEENSQIRILAYGGDVSVDPTSIEKAQASYADWSKGVKNGEIAFVDSTEIIPIWDIVAQLDIDNATGLSENLEGYFNSQSDKISSEFKDSVSVKQYIASVHIGTGDSEMKAKNVLRQLEILEGNIVNLDLNSKAGGNYIYLGYKTTTDPAMALTGICANYFSNASSSDITYKDSKYTIIPTDLNKGAGGKFIYLYYTSDSKAGKPITGIQWQQNNSFQLKTADGYEVVRCTTDGGGMDFNKSVGGDYIYLWFTRK